MASQDDYNKTREQYGSGFDELGPYDALLQSEYFRRGGAETNAAARRHIQTTRTRELANALRGAFSDLPGVRVETEQPFDASALEPHEIGVLRQYLKTEPQFFAPHGEDTSGILGELRSAYMDKMMDRETKKAAERRDAPPGLLERLFGDLF